MLERECDRRLEGVVRGLVHTTYPSVSWADINELVEINKDALSRALAQSLNPRNVDQSIPKRFLFYGPPGNGKTSVTYALAKMTGASLIFVTVSDVLSRQVKNPAKKISAIFCYAVKNAPTIIHFDEVDALLGNHEVNDSLLTSVRERLLKELDALKTLKTGKLVLVTAETYKPWVLDDVALSRFDLSLYVSIPKQETRKRVFRKFLGNYSPQIDDAIYDELARLTEGFSLADLHQVCVEAVIATKLRESKKTTAESLDERKSVVEELFNVIKSTKPYVPKEKIKQYEEWKSALSHALFTSLV